MPRRTRGQTSFQTTWTKEYPWVKPVPNDPRKASCELCGGKEFAVDSMGRQAVLSHAQSQKHKGLVGASSTTPPASTSTSEVPSAGAQTQLQEPASSSTAPTAQSQPSTSASGPSDKDKPEKWRDPVLADFQTKDLSTRRDIMWCLGAVMNHDSLRASADKVPLFKLIYKDVEDVQTLQLSKSKIAYVIVYGLGDFFEREPLKTVKEKKHFAIGFDESYNKIAKKQQMDTMLRFWDDTNDEVSTRYLTSIFLDPSTGEDLLLGLTTALDTNDLKKLLQIACDGPNVNFTLLRLFTEMQQAEPGNPQLLDLGTCGIHTLHNARALCGREAT